LAILIAKSSLIATQHFKAATTPTTTIATTRSNCEHSEDSVKSEKVGRKKHIEIPSKINAL
jgi:hypothetical protein